MKTIGLIGGMSWESSAEYYKLINRQIRDRLGGQHSAKCVMYSVDFQEIETLQHEDRWAEAAGHLVDAAKRVEAGGADFLLLCTNTMHKVADEIINAVKIPFIHIADATAESIKNAKYRTGGPSGHELYHGAGILQGPPAGRARHRCGDPRRKGPRDRAPDHLRRAFASEKILPESKTKLLEIIDGLESEGCEGVVLGCTELPLLVRPGDAKSAVFDTTEIHATKAVDLALSDKP